MDEFHQKLAEHKDKIEQKLTLSEEKRKKVEESLKEVKRTKVDRVQEEGDSIVDINLSVGIAEELYQSDIVLTREQSKEILREISGDSRSKRQAYRGARYPSNTWINKTVPYFFDSTATETVKSVFKKAAELWTNGTCLDIYEDENATDSIRVIQGGGCYSYVGRIGGMQNLSIGEKCSMVGAAAHELGHALGFFHAHSRPDRDRYITVLSKNIRDGWQGQFLAGSSDIIDIYGLPYDYGSIMQYGGISGSKDKIGKLLTMVPLDLAYIETLGSPFISFTDLLMMNKHYNCTDKCKNDTSAKCENHGFPHPRNCSMCICPGGYGGPLCKNRPEGCGEILVAQYYPIEWTASVGRDEDNKKRREDFDMCYYWIKAPVGKKVMVELLSFKPEGIAVDGCIYAGVEVKWQADQRRSGSRYCSPHGSLTILKSFSNIVPIIMYSRHYRKSTTRIRYQYVDS
ncbi:hypothetical protein Q1695_001846 [Nippostrongylus brasiliensis]|nr:hypothetical protein Q1695_001846 [Nippostrongylus brasiliensis]